MIRSSARIVPSKPRRRPSASTPDPSSSICMSTVMTRYRPILNYSYFVSDAVAPQPG